MSKQEIEQAVGTLCEGALKTVLEQTVAMRATVGGVPKGWEYSCMEDFVLQNGREYTPQPLPEGYERGKPKLCFMNAFKLAQRHGLTYVEGYVLAVIPIMHAWCADSAGMVYDNTLKEPAEEYFGVPFDLTYVMKATVRSGTWGVIDDWQNKWPLLTGEDTDFLAA